VAPHRRGSVRRRGNRFQARYQDPGGRQHSATFSSERQAERWVADQLARTALGGPKASSAPTLAEWSTTWLADVAHLADTIDQRYQALVYLAAYGGLRIGELAGLRVGRVDLVGGSVQVVEQVVEVAGHQHFGPPKTAAGRRSVPVPGFVVDELRPLCCGKDASDLVFTAPGGGTADGDWDNYAAELLHSGDRGVCRIADSLALFDTTRTSLVTRIAAGANTLEITRRAGHSSSAFVLDRYGHLLDQARSETTDRLEEMARRVEKAGSCHRQGLRSAVNGDRGDTG